MSIRNVALLALVSLLLSVSACWAVDIPVEISAQFAASQSRLERMKKLMADDPALGKDAYVRLGFAVVARFRNPVPGGPAGAEADWAKMQSREISQVLDWTEQRINQLAKGAVKPVVVPRPVGGQPEIRDGILYAQTKVGDSGKVTTLPYWFCGYMNYAASAYNTTTNMLADWPDFGVSLLQNAPSLAFVGPGWKPIPNKYSGRYDLNDLPEVLQKAADKGIMLDLGISPHILPDWTFEGSPDVLSTTPSGFIGYNVDHPKAREVLEKWIRMYVPVVKDSPGLFSFYMSNEPSYLHSGRDQWSRPLWTQWLKKTHSSIGALNNLYGTTYKSYDEVPVPGVNMPEGIEAKRAYYDWSMFNDQHFADWHGWINGIIKSVAPKARTHVKAYRTLDFGMDTIWSAGAPNLEALSDYTDFADIDAWPCVPAHEGPDDYWWRSQSLNYDLIHSFRGQPVFDSENHVVSAPWGPQSIAPAQTRATVWQGAMHHRSAAALFVWESWTDGDATGQIFFRPANIYSASQAMIDMNRLGRELAVINKDKPKVALLYSIPAEFWERDYSKILRSVYTALTFMGQPVTFVSERQLTSGKFSSANEGVKWIIVPQATHVTNGAVAGLEKFTKRGGKVLLVGNNCLVWDEYHRPVPRDSQYYSKQIEATADEQAMLAILKPALAAGGLQSVKLTEAATGSDAWQVEYRIVPDARDVLVPMISYSDKHRLVTLHLSGDALDLLTGEKINLKNISLDPNVPRLLRIKANGL